MVGNALAFLEYRLGPAELTATMNLGLNVIPALFENLLHLGIELLIALHGGSEG